MSNVLKMFEVRMVLNANANFVTSLVHKHIYKTVDHTSPTCEGELILAA